MKNLFTITILLLISVSVYGQERDSVKAAIPRLNLQEGLRLPEIESNLVNPLDFNEEVPGNINSNSIWLWTNYALSKTSSFQYLPGAPEPHMLANFHDIYVENNKFSMVQTVLGMAQAGAVGYLAFKSIQKHGFIKNK
jgi:hypothetical protein